jgi:periplasmic copper chaperone A
VRRPLAAALAVLAVLATACGGTSGASSGASKGVDVTKAWSRTTPPGVSVGAVYLTASSDADDALTGASVDAAVAAKAELHTESTSGGMTSMAPVASLAVTKQDPLVLGPLGSHLMLVDLAGPLTKGETFDVTLHFAKAGDERVRVEVRDQAP